MIAYLFKTLVIQPCDYSKHLQTFCQCYHSAYADPATDANQWAGFFWREVGGRVIDIKHLHYFFTCGHVSNTFFFCACSAC